MKVLCVCEHGNVRSVALAYLLKTIYSHEALSCGIRNMSQETKRTLFTWADKVIALDADVFLGIAAFSALNEKGKYSDKLHLVDVGKDKWFNAKDQELLHILYKNLVTVQSWLK